MKQESKHEEEQHSTVVCNTSTVYIHWTCVVQDKQEALDRLLIEDISLIATANHMGSYWMYSDMLMRCR